MSSQTPGTPPRIRLLLLLFALMLLLPAASPAQPAAAAPDVPHSAGADPAVSPVYDVVSIRPHKAGDGSISFMTNLDSFNATNVSLPLLLEFAYDIREDLISGIPKAIGDARFDIRAKSLDADPAQLRSLTGPQRRAMMLPMLAERFQLKAHIETKTLPVYELVLAKGGSRLTATPELPPPAASGADAPKPHTGLGPGGFQTQDGRMTANAVPLATLASQLERELDRTVIDKTGLTGKYTFTLNFAPEQSPDPSSTAPSLFTALQEQLGLKLVPSKGSVDTLVVDHAVMPSEN